MTREELRNEEAEHYEQTTATRLACECGWGDADIQQQCFKAGAEWADQHPQEGLVDIEKVIKFIYATFTETISGNVISRTNTTINKVVEDLRKAMDGKEEE